MPGIKLDRVIKIKSSFFFKIFFFFLIHVLLISLASFTAYRYYVKVSEQQIEQYAVQSLSLSANQMDNALHDLWQTSWLLSENDSFKHILYSDEDFTSQNFYDVINTRNLLYKFTSTHGLIMGAYIYQRHSQYVIDAQGTYPASVFFEQKQNYQKYNPNFWKEMNVNGLTFKLLGPTTLNDGINKQDVSVFPLVQPGMDGFQSNNLFVMNVNRQKLSQLLIAQKPTPNSILLVIDNDGNIYANSSTDPLMALDSVHLQKFKTSTGIPYTDTLFNQKMFVISQPSQSHLFETLTYVALVPVSDLSARASYIKNLAYALSLLGLLVMIALSYYLSWRIYKPIGRLVRVFAHDQKSENLFQKDELLFIQQEIQDVLSKNKQLETNLNHALPLVCERAFLQVLNQHEFSSNNEMTLLLEKHGVILKNPYFLAVVLQINFSNAFYENFNEEEKLLILNGTLKLFKNGFHPEYQVYVLTVNNHQLCLILNLPENETEQTITHSVQKIMNLFSEDNQYINMVGGIGNIHVDFAGLHRSYKEAVIALSMLSSANEETIMLYTEKKKREIYSYSIEEENRIFNFLSGGFKRELNELVNQIISRNMENKTADEGLKELYLQLYNTALRVLAKRNLSLEDFSQNPLNNLSIEYFALSHKEMHSFVLDLFESIVSYNNRLTSGKSDISVIVAFINQHFLEPIYLEQLADQFSLSVPYLSKLLKSHLGINFHEYISKLRINRAKKLLQSTSKSINEVALECGFNNYVTFVRIFKKVEGITPGQYRTL